MIRWYDWLAAFIVADFLFANFMIAMFGDNIWLQIVGAISVVFLWDLWGDVYCKFRLRMETKNE